MQNFFNKNDNLVLLALGLISYASIVAELVLTKFISYKVYHHFAYAIISLLMFAFGLAGVIVYLFNKYFGNDSSKNWFNCSMAAVLGALLQLVLLIKYSLMVIEPSNLGLSLYSASVALPICLLIFAIPFLCIGISITHTFTASKIDLRFLYFIDLLLAAFGAVSSIWLIEKLGGFGTIFLCAFCYFLASLCYLKISNLNFKKNATIYSVIFAITGILFINFPGMMIKQLKIDILTAKSPQLNHQIGTDRFTGFSRTYWNSIARIDLSKTVEDIDLQLLTWGLSIKKIKKPLFGRFILVDGGAATRQIKLPSSANSMSLVSSSIFALPYKIDNKPQKALVIGGGGGIDILIGKYFKVPELDVCEFNPSLYNVLTGQADDPDRQFYYPYLISNNDTKVNIYNKEGRHFVSASKPAYYDIIQMSGVDTLTAISGGGLSLSENYLYTIDAAKCYYRLLTPNGILSQTHWVQKPSNSALRQFLTYLEFLKSINVENPTSHLLVVAGTYTEVVLKKTPFTTDDINLVKAWSADCGYEILFNPCNPKYKSSQKIFSDIALADDNQLKNIIDDYVYDITPVTDDKPYFYKSIKPKNNSFDNLANFIPKGYQGFQVEDQSQAGLAIIGVMCALALMILPRFAKNQPDNAISSKSSFALNIFFALSGFAFLLFELAIMQIFGIFVGGPFYTMAIVLVSILLGYSLGSLIVNYLKVTKHTLLLIGIYLGLINFLYFASLRNFINQWLSQDMFVKYIIAAFCVLIVAVPMGMFVPCAANLVKNKYGNVVSWMIGINYAFNVLGGLCFITISQNFGINVALALAGLAYILSGIVFSYFCWPKLT